MDEKDCQKCTRYPAGDMSAVIVGRCADHRTDNEQHALAGIARRQMLDGVRDEALAVIAVWYTENLDHRKPMEILTVVRERGGE